MDQGALRRMTEERIRDAEALADAGRWEFAYYAAGYAVECALKSCVLSRMTLTSWVFDERVKRVDDCRTHDFMTLVQIAGLRGELDAALKQSVSAGGEFTAHWDRVNQWKVTSRYEPRSEAEAKGLLAAITDGTHGVLRWLRNYW